MWDDKLHFLAFAFNSACHESTKMCPSKLFLGRELNTPLENVWDLTEVHVSIEKERTKPQLLVEQGMNTQSRCR